MYTISYEKLGQIWFLPITLDLNSLYKAPANTLVPADEVGYASFEEQLPDTYRREFGDSIVGAFPSISERSLCSYVEFVTHLETPNADRLMSAISGGRFKKEQLEIGLMPLWMPLRGWNPRRGF